jgi:hypothetical protein
MASQDSSTDLAAIRARLAAVESERDALLRRNIPQFPDLDAPGEPEAYWQRMKVNAAILHLRDIEDYYRPVAGLFSQARADRVRDIYEQLSEDYLNGNLDRPTMVQQLTQARQDRAALMEALEESLERVTEHYEGCLYCGEGEIVGGTTTPAHRAECWYYKAQAVLAERSEQDGR